MLSPDVQGDWEYALAAFKARFVENDLVKWQKAGQFWTRNQAPGELVDEYAASLQKIAKTMGVGDEVTKHAFMRGLRSDLRCHVIQSNATTFGDVVRAARVAEVAVADTCQSTSSDPILSRVLQLGEQNAAELKRLSARVAATSVSAVDRAASPSNRPTSPGTRVMFADSEPRRFSRPSYGRGRPQQSQPTSIMRPRNDGQNSATRQACPNCGGMHAFGARYCRAYGVMCYNCQSMNHLARMCRKAKRPQSYYNA